MLAAAWLLISGTSQIGFSRQAQEFDVAKAVKEWNYYEKEYTKTTAEATWLNSQSPTGEGKNITFSESAIPNGKIARIAMSSRTIIFGR